VPPRMLLRKQPARRSRAVTRTNPGTYVEGHKEQSFFLRFPIILYRTLVRKRERRVAIRGLRFQLETQEAAIQAAPQQAVDMTRRWWPGSASRRADTNGRKSWRLLMVAEPAIETISWNENIPRRCLAFHAPPEAVPPVTREGKSPAMRCRQRSQDRA